jgi:protein-disulfide isomerase
VGVVGLFALLFMTLQGEGAPTPVPETELAEFCTTNEENCVAKGNPEAPVTVVEVSDYGCPHCRNFNLEGTAATLDDLYVKAGQVRWVVVPFALRSTTEPAAAAALCAAEQDQFFPFHHYMFEIQDTDAALSRTGFVQGAEALDMDVDAFEDCLNSGRYRSVVQRNIAAARSAGVTGTPAFFVNGARLEGNQPLSSFQEEIERALGS